MAWFIVIVILFLILIAIGLYWAFDTAFVRKKGRLFSVDSGPLAKYKDIFNEGLKYIDSLECERLYIKSFDGLKLAASYYNNDSENTILLFHGYRSDGKFDFACVVKYYIELGLNVLVVDQRANGESEGRLTTFGIKERRDVVSWTNFINDKKTVTKDMLAANTNITLLTVFLLGEKWVDYNEVLTYNQYRLNTFVTK